MNFDVAVDATGGRLQLSDPAGGFQFELSAGYAERNDVSLEADRYTLGVRPENVSVTDAGAKTRSRPRSTSSNRSARTATSTWTSTTSSSPASTPASISPGRPRIAYVRRV